MFLPSLQMRCLLRDLIIILIFQQEIIRHLNNRHLLVRIEWKLIDWRKLFAER